MIAEIKFGVKLDKKQINRGTIPVIASGKTSLYNHTVANRPANIITVGASGRAGYVWYHDYPIFANDCSTIYTNNVITTKYIYYYLKSIQQELYALTTGTARRHLYLRDLKVLEIPLPSFEEQKKIVEKEEVFKKYRLIRLGEIIRFNRGKRYINKVKEGVMYPVYGSGGEMYKTDKFNREDEYVISRGAMSKNCVRYVKGKFWLTDGGNTFTINTRYQKLCSKAFIGHMLKEIEPEIFNCGKGIRQLTLDSKEFYNLEIPLLPLKEQIEIISK